MINQGYLSQIENDQVKNPSIKTLQKITKVFIELEDLLELKEIELMTSVIRLDYYLRSTTVTIDDKKELREKLAGLHKRINWS